MKRVPSQREAAEWLSLTTSRLRQMEKESPWWTPGLRTAEGYDIVGIVRAQMSYHDSAAGQEAARKRMAEAELVSAESKARADQLKAWELERQKALAEKQILPADVYIEFTRELLGMVRSSLEELPESMAEHVPPEFVKFVYIPENEQGSERDASPLQKSIRKLITNVESWLREDAEAEAAV